MAKLDNICGSCSHPEYFHGDKDKVCHVPDCDCTHFLSHPGDTELAPINPEKEVQKSEFKDEDSNLVRHARYELELLGEDPEIIDGYLDVVRAFAKMGHSGGSASVAIPVITKILKFENLKPITNNPEEWQFISGKDFGLEEDVYQSRRDPRLFSTDGGKTYYNVEEKTADSWVTYQSQDMHILNVYTVDDQIDAEYVSEKIKAKTFYVNSEKKEVVFVLASDSDHVRTVEIDFGAKIYQWDDGLITGRARR